MAEAADVLRIGKHSFRSRLFLGTGKYATLDLMNRALDASGCECVTVAVRRANVERKGGEPSLLDALDLSRYAILPNTAGCFNAEDAIRTAHLAREFELSDMIKVEVLADPQSLLPDPVGTLEATKRLVKDGFTVLVYTSDDPIQAQRLEEAGAASVMPLGSPIGSGQGILNPRAVRIIIERAKVPVIVDAGVGTASDTAVAMELGAAGVLMNTGVALARDPVAMAAAMKHACIAGRLAAGAGRIPRREWGQASSPVSGTIGAPAPASPPRGVPGE
ncbi:MAG: thiazole synthase [Planctomycetes bacterium]|nr:thiazole synthase [Planctomycetota bacterium]